KPADWSEEFGEKLPQEILDAINAEYAAQEHTEDQEERLKRVMDRFSKRWRATRARVQSENTDTTTTPTSPGAQSRAPIDLPSPHQRKRRKRKVVIIRPRSTDPTIGQPGTGNTPAKQVTARVGVPQARWVKAEDINDPGMMAAWQKPSVQFPAGCIFL